MRVELAPFRPDHQALVLSWLRSAEEARQWASLDAVPADGSVFAALARRALGAPWIALADGAPAGYGEVWTDDEEHEAELARLIVDPDRRGRGLGRRLVALLAARAAELGFDDVLAAGGARQRAAIACYRAAGFVRATAAQEQEFNTGQPQPLPVDACPLTQARMAATAATAAAIAAAPASCTRDSRSP